MATATAYDAITLDVMLPDTDGFTLCRDFRRHGVTTPVLMITALDTIARSGYRTRQRRRRLPRQAFLVCRTACPAAGAGAPTP